MKAVPLLLLLVFLSVQSLNAQRGSREINVMLKGKEYPVYKDSYALLIGVSDYSNGWPALPGVREDLFQVRSALEKHGFAVMAIWDPDKDQMDDAITEFIKSFGQDPHHRLLIYYAGHGYTSRTSYGEQIGYLVPVDAPRPHLGFGQFQARALEMAQFDLYSKRIQSNHAMFIFDACFSGTLFTGKVLPEPLTEKSLEPVRQFITSGSADEQVPDKSIFCDQLVEALKGDGDYDGDGYITGTELGEYLQKSVINYSRNTLHPQYGKIRNPRLDIGEMIFISPPKTYSTTASVEIDDQQQSRHQPEEEREQEAEPEPEPEEVVSNVPPPVSTYVRQQPVTVRTTLPEPGTAKPEKTETRPVTRSTGEKTGELKVITAHSGDLYINDLFYRTILENSTVNIFNVPTGTCMVSLKGNHPWQKEVVVKSYRTTEIRID